MTRVVLIEDYVPDATWFQIMLSEMRLPLAVTVFQSAPEAFDAFRSGDPPDLIVCDWFLPPFEFPELLRRLRSIPGYERTPVAAFVIPHSHLCQEASRLGAVCCLTKPIDEEQMRALLANLPGYADDAFPEITCLCEHQPDPIRRMAQLYPHGER